MLRRILCFAACAEVATALRVSKEEKSPSGAGHYYWPNSRGAYDSTGLSPFVGPIFKLQENNSAVKLLNYTVAALKLNQSADGYPDLLWSWHDPQGTFHTIPIGAVVDDQQNIYLSTDNSMWKLTPNGKPVWSWAPFEHDSWITSAPAIADGRIFFATENGRVRGLSMDTGKEIWSFKISHKMNRTVRTLVSVHDGIVVSSFNATWDGHFRGNGFVVGFRASDGHPAWAMKTDAPTNAFHPCFPGDGTVVFQDAEGKAYSHNLKTGIARWKTGGVKGTWTHGSPVVANGVLYTVVSNASDVRWQEDGPEQLVGGFLTARNASTGEHIWSVSMPLPPNGAPVVGRLAGRSGLSIIQPCGTSWQNGTTAIYAFDAAVGTKQWSFRGPTLNFYYQPSVFEGMGERVVASVSDAEVRTQPWSAPVIDANGTVYVGSQDGCLYRLRDDNMDGVVEGREEVSYIDTGAASFSSSSPIILPGMMLFANTNSMVAIRTNSTVAM